MRCSTQHKTSREANSKRALSSLSPCSSRPKKKAVWWRACPVVPSCANMPQGTTTRCPKPLSSCSSRAALMIKRKSRRSARAHKVCPFELSLDLATWSDLIIGDYNYIFDPVVRLQRFIAQPNMHLLVDEAHQLSPQEFSRCWRVQVTSVRN